MAIDWTDPSCPISKYFSVREALWLPKWNRMAKKSDGLNSEVMSNIAAFAVCHMDQVRDFVGIPIHVHCWYRPQTYNERVGGAISSAHMSLGDWSACDWSSDVENSESIGKSCDILKASLLPYLAEWGIRMENNGTGAEWIHLDSRPPSPNRYFTP